MEMTPREIVANFYYAVQRENRQTANMISAVRLAMGGKAKDVEKVLRDLSDG